MPPREITQEYKDWIATLDVGSFVSAFGEKMAVWRLTPKQLVISAPRLGATKHHAWREGYNIGDIVGSRGRHRISPWKQEAAPQDALQRIPITRALLNALLESAEAARKHALPAPAFRMTVAARAIEHEIAEHRPEEERRVVQHNIHHTREWIPANAGPLFSQEELAEMHETSGRHIEAMMEERRRAAMLHPWNTGMAADQYQLDAARTLIGQPDFEITPEQIMLAWNALGLAGEAGEVVESLKKMIFHQHGIDVDVLSKELGDVLWYVAALCTKLGLSMSDVMERNIVKLRLRFPGGWKPEHSTAEHKEETDGAEGHWTMVPDHWAGDHWEYRRAFVHPTLPGLDGIWHPERWQGGER